MILGTHKNRTRLDEIVQLVPTGRVSVLVAEIGSKKRRLNEIDLPSIDQPLYNNCFGEETDWQLRSAIGTNKGTSAATERLDIYEDTVNLFERKRLV